MQMLFAYSAGPLFVVFLMVLGFFNGLLGPNILTFTLNAPFSYIMTFLFPGTGINVLLKMMFSLEATSDDGF